MRKDCSAFFCYQYIYSVRQKKFQGGTKKYFPLDIVEGLIALAFASSLAAEGSCENNRKTLCLKRATVDLLTAIASAGGIKGSRTGNFWHRNSTS